MAAAATKLGCVPDIPAPYPWPAQAATGVGSLPGTDPLEATRLIFDELPDLPHLPELPGRGPGADLTGRTAALLIGLPAELTTKGWRFAERPGRELRRAQSLLSRDLDALEEVADGYRGGLKIQACGPWTMAATIELTRSQEPVLRDRGATADLAASLAEGLAAHVADVRRRVPGAQVLLQLDEPALPAVLAGRVPSASGLNRVAATEPTDAQATLAAVLAAAGAPGLVHCCAPSVPLGIIRGAGAAAAGIDLGQLRRGEEEMLAEAVEAGLGIFAGAVPATPPPATPAPATPSPEPSRRGGRDGGADQGPGQAGPPGRPGHPDQSAQRNHPGDPPTPRQAAARVTELWRRMGWPVPRQPGHPESVTGSVAAQVVITPGCGLAGAPPGYAQAALARCREAARMLPEMIEQEAR
jgi:hypothetical protein